MEGAGRQIDRRNCGPQRPSLRLLLSRICQGRAFSETKRTLDSVSSFHGISMESEGKKTLKGRGICGFRPVHPQIPSATDPPSLCLRQERPKLHLFSLPLSDATRPTRTNAFPWSGL